MGFLRRGQSTRSYPAAGTSVTGPADRFRRSKTSGARKAAKAAQKWEDQDRAKDTKSGWRISDWTR